MPNYSHSKLKAFEICPLQYKFIYMDRMPRREEGIEGFLGTRFHEAMEELYKNLKFKIPTLEELLEFYEYHWDKDYSDKLIIVKENLAAKDYKNLGNKFITDYYKRYYPFNQSITLGLEKGISIDLLGDGKYKLNGYIDRIALAPDNVYEIHDYKTSGSLTEQKYLDEDRQLSIYQLGVEKMWPDAKTVKLIWHYIAFDKEMASARTPEHLDRVKNEVIKTISRIENTKEFLPTESALCQWCSFADICPKKKHMFQVEALPKNEYLNDDGVKLVNEFSVKTAELTALRQEYAQKAKEIEESLGKIREAVINYAKTQNMEVIYGSDYKLTVKNKPKVSGPKKDTKERAALEQAIKEINKWAETSTLDTGYLEKVITENLWPAELTEKISKFLLVEPRTTVSLSKLKDPSCEDKRDK
ncbi:MAG: hypothetical protein A2252_12745 [Elusimicrobia bacterium RIFOXYA2_FULL_39_19]|nr:MAG: hypothetical protein A2252_12745 [Elusimicrobia bacterium RIFOXYA2_FULL_39_19]